MTAPSAMDRLDAWSHRLAAWVLVAVFAWAGVAKLADPAAFAAAIDGFRLIPPLASALLAVYLPWFEIVLAAALLTRPLRRPAALFSTLLLLVFTLATVLALARGLDIRCGCFGSTHSTSLQLALLRDLGLLLAAVFVASK